MTSTAELTLEAQLSQAGIPFEREHAFAKPRRWRSDFMLYVRPIWDGENKHWLQNRILIEIDGGSWLPKGRHTTGKGFEADLEKLNAATLLGYRVLRFTPAMVEDGRALSVIRQALGAAA